MVNKTIIFSLLFLCLLFSGCSRDDGSPENDLELEKLKSLPYISHTTEKVNQNQSGVTIYNPDLAFDGYNLYKYILIDMEGEVVHRWKGTLVTIFENGDIVARYKQKLQRYDSNLKPVWETSFEIHHEIILTSEGNILTLTLDVHKYNNRNVKFDVIVELSPDGDEIDRWSTYDSLDHIKKFHRSSKLDRPARIFEPEIYYDYYHVNSIQELPETPLGKQDDRFRKGNWLVDIPFFNLVVILDKETKEIVWTWGPGEISVQHMPRMLENGNILIFDNGKHVRDYSRVIELDPVKQDIVWEYIADPPRSFFTAESGSAQRLPNGNTLITESNKGRVFEVTKDGEIVWEWFNPKITEDGKRNTLYRMRRVSREKIDKVLNQYKSPHPQ